MPSQQSIQQEMTGMVFNVFCCQLFKDYVFVLLIAILTLISVVFFAVGIIFIIVDILILVIQKGSPHYL